MGNVSHADLPFELVVVKVLVDHATVRLAHIGTVALGNGVHVRNEEEREVTFVRKERILQIDIVFVTFHAISVVPLIVKHTTNQQGISIFLCIKKTGREANHAQHPHLDEPLFAFHSPKITH